MFAKVHPAKDVQSGNTGSCHDLVHYLQKEGDTGLAFFSHTDNDVSPEKVITDIDATEANSDLTKPNSICFRSIRHRLNRFT